MQEIIDLHVAAAFNAYLFLDTIAWDVSYPAPRHLGGTWQFLADHADGVIFISQFTRDRFRHRFRVRAGMRELVAYLSFDPADYVRPNDRVAPHGEEFIFVVGNDYDHKDVVPTVELLAAAFPYQAFVALGPPRSITPRVRMLQSGKLSETAIHRLYATARMVVFPSFYEGFGFPVLTTLAYGGTLVARRSALLDEIAARCMPRGRIVPFTRRDDLVTVVGQVLHGEDVTTLPLGTAIDEGGPLSWHEIGGRILAFLTEMAADLSRSRFRARDHLVAQLMAAPMALTDAGLKRPARPFQSIRDGVTQPASDLATTVDAAGTSVPRARSTVRTLRGPLVQAGLIAAALWVLLEGWHRDIRVPFGFVSDSVWYLMQSKSTIDNGWWWWNPRLGAPAGLDEVSFPSNTTVDQVARLAGQPCRA